MRAESAWVPTKFVRDGDGWRGTRDTTQLLTASRITADRAVRAYVEAIQQVARGDLIDLGCGEAPLYGAYRPLVSTVTCVDWPGTEHRGDHLDIEADLTQPLDMLADASFDTVLLTDVLEHLPEPEATLAEVDRILRPAGHIIVGVPFLYWLHETPHDFHRYTEFALRRMVDRLDHEIVRLEPLGGPVEVLFDIVGKLMAGAGAPSRVVAAEQWAGERAGRVFRGSRRAKADALFPSGYVLISRKPPTLSS